MPHEHLAPSLKSRSRLRRTAATPSPDSIDPRYLSDILKSKDFSIVQLEALFKYNKIDIENLSKNIKSELQYLCSINKFYLRCRPGFCDELIRWSDRHIRAIPPNTRMDNADAVTLLAIQRFATNQLFMPDSGNGLARDRWYLLRDYFNAKKTSFGAAPRKRMELADPSHHYAYASEFRYAGHMSILHWATTREEPESLGEHIKRHPKIDDETYNHKRNDRYFIPIIKQGKICNENGNKINQERYIYVLLPDNTFVVAFPSFTIGAFQHSYLNGGRRVICAGEVAIADGQIIAINRRSGHYKPSPENLNAAIKILQNKGFIRTSFINMNFSEIGPSIYGLYKSKLSKEGELPELAPAVEYRPAASDDPPLWQEKADTLMHAFRKTSMS